MEQNLNQLRVFVEVVDRGGFTAAARALDMPRSTVSRWIQDLEKRLGARLLQRTTRTLQLTEIGRGYYERGQEVVQLAGVAQTWVESQTAAPQGTLRITTFELFASRMLGPVVVSYLAENPGMTVQVMINERNADLVGENMDLAVRIGTLEDSSLVVRKLADLRGTLVASPRYLEERGSPRHPLELADHENMIYGHDRDLVSLTLTQGDEAIEVPLPSRCVANSIEFVRQVSLGGGVIGVVPPILVREDLAAGRLVHVLPARSLGSLPIYVAYPSRTHLPRKVRNFVDLLADRVTNASVDGPSTLTKPKTTGGAEAACETPLLPVSV